MKLINHIYATLEHVEVNLTYLPKAVVTTSPNEIFEFIKSINFFALLIPLVAILIGITPALLTAPLNIGARVVYWMCCLLGYFLSATSMLLTMAALVKIFRIRYFVTLITCLIMCVASIYFAEHASHLLMNVILGYNYDFSTHTLRFFVIVWSAEYIALLWILPLYRDRKRVEYGNADAKPLVSAIEINGQFFLISEIRCIKASQHYVIIRLMEREVIVRSSFKSVIDKMPDGVGLIVRRSVWVAYGSINYDESLQDKTTVTMLCGEKIIIPRVRQESVRGAILCRVGTV